MARQDYDRDDDRYERPEEDRYRRPGNGGERDDRWRPGRRQGSGREHSDVRDRDDGREQDWRTGPGYGYEGSRRYREGLIYGAGEHGTQQWGEGRYGDLQDREWRERNEGDGGRGWESSGLGGPSTYGGSRTYGGSSMYGGAGMYGGPYGAGSMGMGMGKHFGRGPKGYRRSDERIREDVNEALFRDENVDATEIEVEVRESEVTLSGTVDSREAKRLAEDCVWNVSGVQNVTNTIRVEPARHHDEWKRATSDDPSRARRTGQTGQRTGGNI